MRTYGRVNGVWTEVSTDADGHDDMVWATTLVQELKLNINESPFYADHGIPAKQSVIQQVLPDFYVSLIQRRFAQHFASLIVSRVQGTVVPTYSVQIVTNYGSPITAEIPT